MPECCPLVTEECDIAYSFTVNNSGHSDWCIISKKDANAHFMRKITKFWSYTDGSHLVMSYVSNEHILMATCILATASRRSNEYCVAWRISSSLWGPMVVNPGWWMIDNVVWIWCLLARDVQAQDATWRSTNAVKVKRKVRADEPRAVKGEHE